MDTTQAQSIDDLFDRLLTMGFDYDDCQQALSAGILSLPEAVEWILGGKPGQGAAGPKLQLRRTINSVFDSPGLQSKPETGESCSVSCEKQAPVEEAPPVHSGIIRSEEQRKQWDKFHEKQRVEAEQTAKMERLRKRKEHSDVLQQIALDRMEKKQLHALVNSPNLEKREDALPKKPSLNTSATRTTIQVRCPNGSVIKREFNCNDKLCKLWDAMKIEFPDCGEIALLQPFPRYEFSAQDINRTYLELGLVPSGSLVLNIQQSNNTTALPQRPPSPPIVMNRRRRAAPVHVDVPRQQHMEEDAIFGLPGGQQNARIHPLQGAPGQNLMAEMHQVLENAGLGHVWGSGHKLDDNENNEEKHRKKNPLDLAREAALMRAFNAEPSLPEDSEPTAASNSVPKLEQLCIHQVVKGIVNPYTCSAGLSLPAGLAEKILKHMKRELVLSPRTLQPFLSCHLDCVILDFYPYATNELLYGLRFHTTIRHLSLAGCILINDSGLQILTSLKRILSLNLRECNQITDSAFQYISELRNLTTLNLDRTKVTDSGLQSYISSKPTCLQYLTLSCTLITDNVLKPLSALTQLRSLNLDDTQVRCLKQLCPLINLESLSIRAVPVSPDALVWLGKLPKLNTLNIFQLPHVEGDKALELIKDLALTNLKMPSRLTISDLGMTFIQGMSLSTIDLTNYIHLTDAGIICLRKMSSLKVLILNNTKLTDVGLLALGSLHNLEVLYLDRTGITDNGLFVLKEMPKLAELSLAYTSTGKVYLKAGVLNGCNLLSKLNLSYTQVTDAGLRKLCLPKLSLISLDGTRLRSEPRLLLTGCPHLQHISDQNIEPRGLYDSDSD